MKLYFISGLGANKKAFDYIIPHWSGEKVYLEWLIPYKDESLHSYARRMAKDINPDEDFALIGLSFGGVIAQELNSFLNPIKTILISSIKTHDELRPGFKFLAQTGLHKNIPLALLSNNTLITYALARRLYYKSSPSLETYFTHRNPYYIKWAIHKILSWKEPAPIENLIHIHGNNDLVFPLKYIKNAQYIIPNGSHIMVFDKSRQINRILEKELNLTRE